MIARLYTVIVSLQLVFFSYFIMQWRNHPLQIQSHKQGLRERVTTIQLEFLLRQRGFVSCMKRRYDILFLTKLKYVTCSFRLSCKLCLCNSFHGCFVPNSKKGQNVDTLVFVLFTFQMLCPFLVSPLKTPHPLPLPLFPKPTHSCFLAQVCPYIGPYNLHRTKGLSSHWWLTRPSSAKCAPRAMSLAMFSLIGGLVAGNSGVTGYFILLFFLWGYKPLQLLGYFF
jgi:hypothetical protein